MINREVIFRGNRKDNGYLVEGSLAITSLGHFIFALDTFIHDATNQPYYRWLPIVPITIRQFTGFLDINGQKIYEGDITNIFSCPNEVFWSERRGQWGVRTNHYDRYPIYSLADFYGFKVIGSIYDAFSITNFWQDINFLDETNTGYDGDLL